MALVTDIKGECKAGVTSVTKKKPPIYSGGGNSSFVDSILGQDNRYQLG